VDKGLNSKTRGCAGRGNSTTKRTPCYALLTLRSTCNEGTEDERTNRIDGATAMGAVEG
jgi:hypothetical protein